MTDAGAPPYWAAPAILSAALAALGYVGKLVTDFASDWRSTARKRQARLAELFAMLRAGDVAFQVQCDIRDRLEGLLAERRPDLLQGPQGFNRLFSLAYPDMAAEELQLHTLIRAYTVHTLKPLNDGIIDWLRTDVHFRGLAPTDPRFGELALYLPQLEAHLLLWRAKYEAWIPHNPEHCVVYLADEERHGLGFPPGGTRLVATLLGHKLPTSNTAIGPTGLNGATGCERE